MKNEKWPYVLMGVGFTVAFICLGTLLFTEQSGASEVVLMTGHSLGIGVGSIGFGGFLTRNRRR